MIQLFSCEALFRACAEGRRPRLFSVGFRPLRNSSGNAVSRAGSPANEEPFGPFTDPSGNWW